MPLRNATDQSSDQKGLGKPHKPQGREKEEAPRKRRKGSCCHRATAGSAVQSLHKMATALKSQPSPVYTDRLVHNHETALVQQIFPSRTSLLNAARKSSKDWRLRSISSHAPPAGMPRTPAAPRPANLPSVAAELSSCCSGLRKPPGSRFLLPPSRRQILEIFPISPFSSPFPTSLCSLSTQLWATAVGQPQNPNHFPSPF